MLPAEIEAVLTFENVNVDFQRGTDQQDLSVLREITFDVNGGEFIGVVGPSGCGKSTLLNVACGLLKPTNGRVLYAGHESSGVNTEVGYVTQRDNLYHWRTVLGNVQAALEFRGVEKRKRTQMAQAQIRSLGLGGFENYYPHQLSGGMRMKVSIARTMVYDPPVIFMDEPFGSLDAQTRFILQQEIIDIWAKSKKTIVFVTHDLQEAITLADRVVVMSSRPGRIKKILRVPLARPRKPEDAQLDKNFSKIYIELLELLKPDLRIG